MATLRSIAVAVVLAAACRTPRIPATQHRERAASGDDITLYRDAAVIRQRVVLELPATPTTVTVQLARGVAAEDISIIDRGGIAIQAIHAETGVSDLESEPPAQDEPPVNEFGDVPNPGGQPAELPGDLGDESDDIDDIEGSQSKKDAPTAEKTTELRLDVKAPRAGTYALTVGYITKRLPWDAAYTMVAAPARDRGDLSGALAIRNETGIALRATSARVVDAELETWRKTTAERVAVTLVGGTHASQMLPATPRELGPLVLRDGETRVELARDTSRRIRSVLVYDAIGRKLDNPGPSPLRDVELGTRGASTRVTESFELVRDLVATAGLPGGPVRLLERRTDSSLAVLGESRLYDASTRLAHVDTIDVGIAHDVTGTRERRELTIDDENRRLVEEIAITLDNRRAHPVEVVVREHLYRGQNWTLAYHSAPEAAKEGAQQIAMRAKVPARSKLKIVYVVVYTSGQ